MFPIMPPLFFTPSSSRYRGSGGLEKCDAIGIPMGMGAALILAGVAIVLVVRSGWSPAWESHYL